MGSKSTLSEFYKNVYNTFKKKLWALLCTITVRRNPDKVNLCLVLRKTSFFPLLSPSFFPSKSLKMLQYCSFRCYVLLDCLGVRECPKRKNICLNSRHTLLLNIDSFLLVRKGLNMKQNWLSYFPKSNSILLQSTALHYVSVVRIRFLSIF